MSDGAVVDFTPVLAAHPSDAWLVLRAVRDTSGSVTDFIHQWSNATADRNAGVPLTGTSMLAVFGPDNVPVFELQAAVLARGGTAHTTFTYDQPHHDPTLRGRTFELHVHAVDTDRLVAQYRDITAVVTTHEQLTYQAGTDELTGLPNRRRLREVLFGELRTATPADPVAVLLVDLDRFKAVNDTYGHDAGDELLRHVSGRMRSVLRPPDLLARFGGDEFVIVCRGLTPQQTTDVAARVVAVVGAPYRLRDHVTVTIGASVGVAHLSEPGRVDAALRAADVALYQTKTGR